MIHAMTRTRPVALATSLALALSGTLLLVAPQGAEARPRAARAPSAHWWIARAGSRERRTRIV